MRSCIYRGSVTHKRVKPLKHQLRYSVFMVLLDLSELETLGSTGKWFGYNRRAIFSFHDKDHGARDPKVPLREWVLAQLRESGLDGSDFRISILCFPRVLGYGFNPLALIFCHDGQNKLRAVFYEVNNTFGEQHGYLFVDIPEASSIDQACAKEFYVSPFMAMQAQYQFSLAPPGEKFMLSIRQTIDDEDALFAVWKGDRHNWSQAVLRSCFWNYPLLSFKIITAIHWHGLRLFLKGAKFHSRPPLPRERVSVHR